MGGQAMTYMERTRGVPRNDELSSASYCWWDLVTRLREIVGVVPPLEHKRKAAKDLVCDLEELAGSYAERSTRSQRLTKHIAEVHDDVAPSQRAHSRHLQFRYSVMELRDCPQPHRLG